MPKLRHEIIDEIPKQDKQERVKEYIRTCFVQSEQPQSQVKPSQKKPEQNDDGMDFVILSSSQYHSDILDGRRAKEKRLYERKERRRKLAEMRKSPKVATPFSDISSGHNHREKSSIQERGKHIYVQDRSRSKASRLRKEAKEKTRVEKEKENGKKHRYLDLLGLSRPTRLSNERVTIPQPRNGIFGRGTASPHIATKKSTNRKREHEEVESTISENSSNSSAQCHTHLDRAKDERIAALEEQMNDLRRRMEDMQEEKNVQSHDHLETANQFTANAIATGSAEVQTNQVENSHHDTTVAVNVSHLPWSKAGNAMTQNDDDEQAATTVPVLAFNGDKPISHPNGWRAQHNLHGEGLHSIQQKYREDGGAKFRVSSPRAVEPIVGAGETLNEPELNLFREDPNEQKHDRGALTWQQGEEPLEEEALCDEDDDYTNFLNFHDAEADIGQTHQSHENVWDDHDLIFQEENDVATLYGTEDGHSDEYNADTIDGLNQEDLRGFWRPIL